MPSFREEIIGGCRLILGDCREVLPTLGNERDPLYFDLACRRIERASRQGDLIRDVYERPTTLEPML